MTNSAPFQPDWVSPPGDTISDALAEQDLTQAEFAARTGFTRKHVNDLVRGRATITAETAIKLAAVLGGTSEFWLAREAQYRSALARRDRLAELRSQADWLKGFPKADMFKYGWVKKHADRGEQVEEFLHFFGVASIDTYEAIWSEPLAAFRTSSKFEKKRGAVAAWLREGERKAAAQRCKPFDKNAVKSALEELRSLTLETEPEHFVPKLTKTCNQVGIAVVFVPTPRGCPASGATKWLTHDKAMLMLSLRHRTHDSLWFSFFHECGHLLLHGKRMLFLEGTDTISERHEEEADAFARDILIPKIHASRLTTLNASKAAVQRFAAEIGIAPGIVVGQMQWSQLLPWSHLNELKVRYAWT